MAYLYGLRARPPFLGCVPRGFVKYEKEHSDFLFGAIYYPEKLTDKQVYDYELVYIGQE